MSWYQPPERHMPVHIEDMMQERIFIPAEDEWGTIDNFDEWEDAEYDDEGFPQRYGGYTIEVSLDPSGKTRNCYLCRGSGLESLYGTDRKCRYCKGSGLTMVRRSVTISEHEAQDLMDEQHDSDIHSYDPKRK